MPAQPDLDSARDTKLAFEEEPQEAYWRGIPGSTEEAAGCMDEACKHAQGCQAPLQGLGFSQWACQKRHCLGTTALLQAYLAVFVCES